MSPFLNSLVKVSIEKERFRTLKLQFVPTFYSLLSHLCFMQIRDERFRIINELGMAGKIQTIDGIFKFIPKTILCHYLGTSTVRFDKLLKKPTLFTLEELKLLALYFELPIDMLISMAVKSADKLDDWPKKHFSHLTIDKNWRKEARVNPAKRVGKKKTALPKPGYQFQNSPFPL